MNHRGWLMAGVVTGVVTTAGIALATVELLGGDRVALDAPRFVEETATAGVAHVYDGGFDFFVGGGVAVFDCDDDNLPDLYVAGGANPASLFRNQSVTGGALAFTEVDDPVTGLGSVTGAYPIDIEGDGITDLVVLRRGENVMLRGLGGCRFERADTIWNLDGGDNWTVAFSAVWERARSLPSLAFVNYLATDEPDRPGGACADHHLFRPGESGYGPPTVLEPGWCALSALFSDWDRSGRADLRVTNDRHYYRDGQEQMWRMEPGETPRLYTSSDGWNTMQIWGMGIASHDLTGDGRPEVFLTSQGDNKLQTLAESGSGPDYVDIAFERGVTAHRPFTGPDVARPSTAWHGEFEDVNNDTYVDLFVTKGNVEAQDGYAADDPNNLLLGHPDGTFTETAAQAGILDFARSRGASVADLNHDGMLDLVVVERGENVKLWRNVGWGDADGPVAMGNWIGLRLSQPGSNPQGIGSWVEVRAGDRVVSREVTIGGGHAGGQAGWIHFGSGVYDTVEIRVQWPDGVLGPWRNIVANRYVTVERGPAG